MKTKYVALALITALVVGCVSSSLSEANKVDVTFGQLSVAYELAQNGVVEARSRGLVSTDQWSTFDNAQKAVARVSPEVRDLITVWKTVGTKPPSFDEKYQEFLSVFNYVVSLYESTRPLKK